MPDGGVQLSVLPGGETRRGTITVVGMLGDSLDQLSEAGRRALSGAGAVAGGRRHLEAWRHWSQHAGRGSRSVATVEMGGDAEEFAHQVARHAVDERRDVCVLASGDPGFFGVLRPLLRVVDRADVRVVPAVSSVAMAFARLGLPWDDAVVVSAHGRPLAEAAAAVRLARKAAVLTSPDAPPQAVGRALIEAAAAPDLVAVCSRLGCADETVAEVSLDELARSSWDPLSVVVVVGPAGRPTVGWGTGGERDDRVLAWGLPDDRFAHRDGMVTKAEVRAVALGKLALPPAGVLWDLGAGSGSVAVECARLCPGLTVFAVEAHPEDAARVAENAGSLGAAVHVVAGTAPGCLQALPDPDRVFVGGGGLDVLDAALGRLRPGGQVVATYAALDRAAAAAERLGGLVQLAPSRGVRLPDGAWRLEAENPVFVVWGPPAP